MTAMKTGRLTESRAAPLTVKAPWTGVSEKLANAARTSLAPKPKSRRALILAEAAWMMRM